MRQRRRWRSALGLAALAALGAVFALGTDRAGDALCAELQTRLPDALGLDVSVGRCRLNPLGLGLRLEQVRLSEPGATWALATADSADVSLRGIFPGYVSLQRVTLNRPQVDLRLGRASAPGPAVGARTCPLDALKRLRVGALSIQQGSVGVTLADGRRVRLEAVDVDASLGRRQASVNAQARAGGVTFPGRSMTLGRLRLDADIDLEGQRLEVRRFEGNLEGVAVTATGPVESLCDAAPTLALSAQVWVPLDALPRLGLELPAPSGQVVGRVAVTGRADAPLVRAEVQASQVVLGHYSPGDFSLKASLAGRQLLIDELVTTSGEGRVRVSGEVSLTDGLPVKARVETTNASFARALARAGITGSWVEFAATVRGGVSGHLQPRPALSGDIDFSTGPFVLATHAFDAPKGDGIDVLRFRQSSGNFRLGISHEGVTFGDVVVRVGPEASTEVRGRVTIYYDGHRGLDIAADGQRIVLDDFGAIAELPWSGVGGAQVHIFGPMEGNEGIHVEGRVSLRDFKLMGYSLGVVQSPIRFRDDVLSFPAVVAQKGQTQYFGDVALAFHHHAPLHVRSTVQLPDGRVEDMVDLLADLSPVMSDLQRGVLTGRVSGLAAVDSPASELTGVIAAHVRDVRYFDRHLGEANLVTRFDHGEALVLEPTVFSGRLGEFSAKGRWDFSGPLDFDLGIAGGRLGELFDPGGARQWPVSGPFTAEAAVGGTVDDMHIDGWLDSPQSRWEGHALGPGRLVAEVRGLKGRVSGPIFTGLSGAIDFERRDDWPYRGALQLSLDDLSPVLPPQAAGLLLTAGGSVDVDGDLLALERTRARAHLTRFGVERAGVKAANVGNVELEWNDGAVAVHALHLRGPTSELVAAGSWGPATVDLKARGALDLALASSFISGLERTQGQLGFTAAFSGPVGDPTLVGAADFSDVRFGVKGQDLQVRALTGRASFSESRVLLEDVRGFLNEGGLRVRGDARLAGLALKSLQVQFDLADVTVRVEDVPVTLSGALLLASRDAEAFQVSGALDVDRFHYTRPLSLEDLLARARDRGVPSEQKPQEWLRYDVDLRASGDVRLDNNLARARLLGKLRLTGSNVKPVIIGAVETAEGAQAFFRNNTYRVSRGLLQFNGLWPTFDLSAQTTARDYTVNVKAFGRLDDPKISLSAEPSLPDADIISLLTIGVTSREQMTGQSATSLAAEALLSASGLDQQVQRFLTESVGLKNQQVRFTTSFNETTGASEPAVQWEGNVLDERLKVGLTQPVTGKGTRAQAEYRINQRVSARASWDNQNQNTTVGNPGLDLRFLFEWE